MVEFLTEVCSITQYSTLKELKEFFINFTERDADLLSRARLMVREQFQASLEGSGDLLISFHYPDMCL